MATFPLRHVCSILALALPRLPLSQATLRFKSSEYESSYRLYYAAAISRFDELCNAMLVLLAASFVLKDFITLASNDSHNDTLMLGTTPRHTCTQLYAGLMLLRVAMQLVLGKHFLPNRNTIILAMRLLQPYIALLVKLPSVDYYSCTYGMLLVCGVDPSPQVGQPMYMYHTVHMLMLHLLGSPMLVPLTATIPYQNHLITVVASAAGAVHMLWGGRSPGLCTALRQLPQPGCVGMWRKLQMIWAPLARTLQVVRNVLGSGVWTASATSVTPPLDHQELQSCVVVVLALHLMFSVLMSCLLYNVELRSRLQWLLQHGDPSSQSASVALLRSGGLLAAWTVNNSLFFIFLGLVSMLVVSLWLQGLGVHGSAM